MQVEAWPDSLVPSAGHDELHGYDGLNRLIDFHRGDLDAPKTGITGLALRQHWHLDATGNWDRFEELDSTQPANLLDQTRAHNAANELTGFLSLVGQAWSTPATDAVGNMTRIPKPASPAQAFLCTYDAWNRLVHVADGSTQQTLAEYAYDGLGYRAVRNIYAGGVLTQTRHGYFSGDWQLLEERVGASANAERQFVWGLGKMDELLLRDRDTTQSGTLDERLYVLQDSSSNVMALADPTGIVVERYRYSPHGTCEVLDGWSDPRSESAFQWEHLFTGRELDSATRLYCYRNRWLDPATGRFLARDPLGLAAGLNYYRANFVPSGTDPFGLSGSCGGPSGPRVPPGWGPRPPWLPRANRGRRLGLAATLPTGLGPDPRLKSARYPLMWMT